MESSKHRVACLYVGDPLAPARFGALAEACLRLSPQVAIRENVAVFVDVSRCQRLYTEQGVRTRLLALATRFEVRDARVAMGWDAATALAAARYGLKDADRIGELPLDALEEVASPFHLGSDAHLEKQVASLIRSLRVLGLKNLSDFTRLPRASIGTRFGSTAVQLSERIHGAPSGAWPGLRVAEKVIEESAVMAGEIQGMWMSLDSILFLLRGLVDRAMARLRGHGQRASRVRIEFRLEKWSTALSVRRRAWELEFPLPQGSASGVVPILRERLGFELLRDPLVAPVEHVRFEILDTVPGLGAQKDFWKKEEEEREQLNGLLGRLNEKLGHERVFQAEPAERYLPEKAWVRSLTDGVRGSIQSVPSSPMLEAGLPTPARPLRLLPEPRRLTREQQASWLRDHESGKRWKVQAWEGPERIESEWWMRRQQVEVGRDYYQLETAEGEKLWVFLIQAPEAQEVFLHGYFD